MGYDSLLHLPNLPEHWPTNRGALETSGPVDAARLTSRDNATEATHQAFEQARQRQREIVAHKGIEQAERGDNFERNFDDALIRVTANRSAARIDGHYDRFDKTSAEVVPLRKTFFFLLSLLGRVLKFGRHKHARSISNKTHIATEQRNEAPTSEIAPRLQERQNQLDLVLSNALEQHGYRIERIGSGISPSYQLQHLNIEATRNGKRHFYYATTPWDGQRRYGDAHDIPFMAVDYESIERQIVARLQEEQSLHERLGNTVNSSGYSIDDIQSRELTPSRKRLITVRIKVDGSLKQIDAVLQPGTGLSDSELEEVENIVKAELANHR
jgi:hypothetical protein